MLRIGSREGGLCNELILGTWERGHEKERRGY
jgi:hypothetical protein